MFRPSVPIRVGEYNHWTGLLDWTTGLTQTAKYTSFSAEQKLNVLIHSVNTDCSLQRLVFSVEGWCALKKKGICPLPFQKNKFEQCLYGNSSEFSDDVITIPH